MVDTLTIGISVPTAKSASAKAIARQIRRLGATPRLFSRHKERHPEEDIAAIHGLILMGNDWDIDPLTYIHRYLAGDSKARVHPETRSELGRTSGRARAAYEEALIRLAIPRRLPLLGICGGMQRINVVLGGTLHQHLPDLVGHHGHCQRVAGLAPDIPIIPLIIEGSTLLAEIARDIAMPFTKSSCPSLPKVIIENSIHHQAVDILAPGLRICGLSEGVRLAGGQTGYIIKAVERDPAGIYGEQFLLGLQWHPEFNASSLGECVARHLLNAAAVYREA